MARVSKYLEKSAPSVAESNWRAGLYIRLSREDGDGAESESVTSQRAILQKFLDEHGDIQLFKHYIDDGWSGTDFFRPAFSDMIADLTAKKINCVIVKDLSRFGRNYVESGKYLEIIFPTLGVRFISVNDFIDSLENPSSMNSMIVPFKNVINDEYCRDVSQKVRSALDIRRRQGKFIGSFAAYGYKKDENDKSKLVIDGEAAQVVRLIFEKFLSGLSVSGVARELNALGIPNPSAYKASKGLNCNRGSSLWLDTTVRRILTNELYIGNLVQKKNEILSYKIHVARRVEAGRQIRIEHAHEPIISVEDFEKVGAILGRDTRVSPKSGKLSLFSGFLKCADCGRSMQKRSVVQPYRTYEYYACSSYRKKLGCSKHTIREDELEEAVLTFINSYIKLAVDFGKLSERVRKAGYSDGRKKRTESELNSKCRELEKTKALILELYPDFKSGILSKDEYFALKQKYETAAERLSGEIQKLSEEIEESDSLYRRDNDFISSLIKYDGLKKLTRDVLIELVDEILVYERGAIEVKMKCADAFESAARALDSQVQTTQLLNST